MRAFSTVCLVVVSLLALANPAFAEEAAHVASTGDSSLGLLAAGIGLALAVIGGALGQSKVIAAALDGISRNPGASGQMFLPWILGVALIESLVILTFVIALKLVGLI
ncbi:MAG: ATP synthase F0 subunit C [Proteobacteria bacterium]|nr:ATP synthase F0 subunit C [Pseudomonadota bacterium]